MIRYYSCLFNKQKFVTILAMFTNLKRETLSKSAQSSIVKKPIQPIPIEEPEIPDRKTSAPANDKSKKVGLRFLRGQNEKKWEQLHIIGHYFMLFLQEVKAKIPSYSRPIQELLEREEEQILAYVKSKLNMLSSTINNILSDFEKEKERELTCLDKMKVQLASFLAAKKEEFKETSLTLPEETILLSSQPLQNEIERLKSYLVAIRQLRMRNTLTPCVMIFEKPNYAACFSSSLGKKDEEAKSKQERKKQRRQSQDLEEDMVMAGDQIY